MRLYKYFGADGTSRFVSKMTLRVTPPDQFNDPFEMRPPIDVANVDELLSPEALRREIADELVSSVYGGVSQLSAGWKEMFASELLEESTSDKSSRFYASTPVSIRNQIRKSMPAMRTAFREGVKNLRDQFPQFKQGFQDLIHQSVRLGFGALCLSRNGNHPLMWAHYADEHRGAVVEFLVDGPCFNRGDYAKGAGKFVDVSYSDSRPVLDAAATSDGALEILALSKASAWKYEEEMRMILPLAEVDEVVEGKYHLIKVDPSSIQSITFGCRASSVFVKNVDEIVHSNADLAHVGLYKVELCQKEYVLNRVLLST